MILEDKVSKLEGKVHRVEEEYRVKLNDYQKKFIKTRTDQVEQQYKETRT